MKKISYLSWDLRKEWEAHIYAKYTIFYLFLCPFYRFQNWNSVNGSSYSNSYLVAEPVFIHSFIHQYSVSDCNGPGAMLGFEEVMVTHAGPSS